MLSRSVSKKRSQSPGTVQRLPRGLLLGCGVAWVLVWMLLACVVGAFPITIVQVGRIALHALGLADATGFSAQQATVLLDLRLPRVLLGLCVGAGLGAAGAALQALFRNPLADPGLIGISAGASLAAGAMIVLGASLAPALLASVGVWAVPGAAVLGAWLAVIVVLRIASGGRGLSGLSEGIGSIGTTTALTLMLLAGVAINALASAGIGLFTYLATDAQLRDLAFWNLGSLSGASWSNVAVVMPAVAIALIVMLHSARALNTFTLGEGEAALLGVAVERLKLQVIAVTALAVGACVAMTGMIGFIGLVAPHCVRLIGGPDQRVVLPGAALFGAGLVLAADVVARSVVAPAELPIGVLTAALGAPFFLWLLARSRRNWSGA